MKIEYTTKNIAALLLLVLIVIGTSGCPLEDTRAEIECPPFDITLLDYFPYQAGDPINFRGVVEGDTVIRTFIVSDRVVFGDTTYRSLFPNEVCSPYATFIMAEQDTNITIFNYGITDFSNNETPGTRVAANISDVDAIDAYTVQFFDPADGSLAEGPNTDLDELGTRVINGVTYDNVVRLNLVTAPEFSDRRFYNDVRSIWIARGAGVVRFTDASLGTFSLLP